MTANILVLISGTGSNLQALIDATNASSSPPSPLRNCRISHVISNKKDVYGLTRAKNASIPTSHKSLLAFKKDNPDTYREKYDAALASYILSGLSPPIKPDLIVCAGWMLILSPAFLKPIRDADIPIINLHPALPGAFDGARAIERAYEAFQRGEVKETGVMVHYVIEEVDAGEPIVVKPIQITEGESLEELTDRIHVVEHEAIVEAAGLVIKRRREQGKIAVSL